MHNEIPVKCLLLILSKGDLENLLTAFGHKKIYMYIYLYPNIG